MSKLIDALKKLGEEDKEKYLQFWEGYACYIKQGVAIEPDQPEDPYPLLRFKTTNQPDQWASLDEVVMEMKPDQKELYYILGDDDRSVIYSPHLDVIRQYGYSAIILTDPVDAFMLVRLKEYQGYPLSNVSAADLELPDREKDEPASAEEESAGEDLVKRFKSLLGDKVSDVRSTDRLSDSPARLVDPEGAPNQEMQRVYRMLERDFQAPKKVLEINLHHPILKRMSSLPEMDARAALLMEQIYEDALLIEGLHPDPAGMIKRIQRIMEAALGDT